jgi:hypothetical protein
LEQGPTEAKIIEQAARLKMPLPDAIKNAPTLEFGLELFYTAFMDLSSERSSGWTTGPIRYSVILEYCAAHEITGEQRDDMLYHIRAMDATYLEHSRKKSETK